MAKIIQNGKVKKFDPSKHKRDPRGRFADKPDAPKPTKVARGQLLKQSMSLRAAKKAAEVYQARLELYQGLNREQRRRLQQVLVSKKTLVEPQSKPKKPRKPKATQEPLKVTAKRSRTPTPIKPVSDDRVSFSDNKLNIWRNTEYTKFDPSFKVRIDRKHKYEITTDDGLNLLLNQHTKVIEFKNETVKGVPSLTPKLREMKPESLFSHMAQYMSYVEMPKSDKAPAPQWSVRYMKGEVPKELLYTFKDGTKSYLSAEIHHNKQWARIDFDDITRRYKAGQITWEEAQEETKKGLFKEKNINKKTGEVVETYQIIPQSVRDRSYVILAGGVHRGGAPLYKYHHPEMVDVESPTPKFKSYGIPKNGRAGRDWYTNNFQNPFWREVYKREAYVIQNEINRRIRNGDFTTQDSQRLWQEAQKKLDKEYQRRLSLKGNK